MAMTQKIVAVGVFEEAEKARSAIDELRRAGFSNDEIGYLAHARLEGLSEATVANTTTGMVEGSVLGGVLGAVATLLIPGIGPAIAGGILAATLGGAALGAAAGGLIGSFVRIGIPEKDAAFYQKELQAGHTVVTVTTAGEDSYGDALAIMRANGSYDASTKLGVINTPPPMRPYGVSGPPAERSDEDEPEHEDL
ncbi:general stress protein [Ktedonospora formicarum]|uniref:General stress protein 17M-like domain-containing protein n=1 Tax=Ktedonospora formicarum TaxID=2778364 RepID=A0A8J3HUD0_9CHLR|nr:general stress protein [Ktedonospora formicarum]GHO43919.1 hypothetical protein KSX_20820 [Ktedonospora formicarum]